jgi:hypothetical protein
MAALMDPMQDEAVSTSRRLGGLAAVVLGLTLAVLLVGIQQYAWDELTDGRLPYLPDSWYGEYRDVYEWAGLPLGLKPYYFWGRFAFLIYGAALLGAWALPHGGARLARVGRRLLLVALAVGIVGDFMAYWGGTDQADFTAVSVIGYVGLEFPAFLATIIAMIVYGVGLLQERHLHSSSGWALLAGGGLVLPGLFVVTYFPHGALITVLASIGVALAGDLLTGRWASPAPT